MAPVGGDSPRVPCQQPWCLSKLLCIATMLAASCVANLQAQALATARLAGEQQVDAMEAELQNKLSQLQQQTQEVRLRDRQS